jgi:hypothetical protein
VVEIVLDLIDLKEVVLLEIVWPFWQDGLGGCKPGTRPVFQKGLHISSNVKFGPLVITAQDDAPKTVRVEHVVVLGEILDLSLEILSINGFRGTWTEYGN